MIARAAAGLCAIALLAGCGDDLESRQAAVQGMEREGGDITVRQAAPEASGPTVSRDSDGDQSADDLDQGAAIDVPPEALIDTAQGFSADPIDDAAGFDPTPDNSGGFAPETMAPESFEE
ncbi:hypothetical protein [Aurantiacibacter odishensis]|uniref:hypothetical protein n=1 Tax=Aurantiacibacter odishensis TaxID=1155476 RepID=UPI000E76DB68|nr:hypothetical protein [Aurantiacibacter odishensis]